MQHLPTFVLYPIGYVRSPLTDRANAPRQAWEHAPESELELEAAFAAGLEGILPGQEIWLLTWLHEAHRSTLQVHPRRDPANPLTGVFATRSPDRPNPIGLHRAKILSIDNGRRIRLAGLEAVDGTPILDIKPVLERCHEH